MKKSAGTTCTEKLLAEFCERSFLKLWSYPNPHKDDGHELCDLLAVFDKHVFIFFDRENMLPESSSSDPQVVWDRWKRNVIDRQVKTAHGAERYILSGRPIFLDPRKTQPFPFSINLEDFIVHKIIVAHGAKEACERASESNIYGSLAISYTDRGDGQTRPFHIQIDRRKPVHILDSHNLPIVLGELDTVVDLSAYLDEKVRAANRFPCLNYCGEEDLLAHYLWNYDESVKRHVIGPKDESFDFVTIGEGEWRDFITTAVYKNIYGDYACSLAVETFMDNGRGRSGGQATPDLALLPGIRFVHTDEPARNARLSESHVKLLTGGDTIQARELNKGFFSFKPQFKLTMSGNYRPKVDGGEASQGTWRRLIMVRWAITVPEQEVDRQLSAKLKAEASGILNRLLDGLCDWIDHGLLVPEEIKETTEEYRSDSDVLGRFLQECTMRAEGQRLSNAELHNLFVVWSRKNGERPWTKKSLTSAMKERDYEQSRGEERYWKDIVATKAVGDFAVSASVEDDLEGEEAENDS